MIQLHSFRQRLTDELQKVEVAILESGARAGLTSFATILTVAYCS